MPTPVDNGAHPRLHFTSTTLGSLRTKIESYLLSEYQDLVDWLEANWATDAFGSSAGGLMADRFAFIWVIRNDGGITGATYTKTTNEYETRALQVIDNTVAAGLPTSCSTLVSSKW